MKKLLFVLGLVVSLFASSQGDRMKPLYNFRGLEIADWYFPPTNYVYVNQRYRWFMGMFDSGFHVPTTTVYPTLSSGQWTGAGGLKYRTTDSSFYGYSAYQWTRLASSQSVNQALANCYGLLNGLAVSYLSGLTFDVSPGDFTLGCFNFHSNGGQVTGTAAHATLSRIDVVLVDTLGAVSILAGTPAADPSKPQIDPSYQLELTFYTVAALATTPTGVSSVNIYLNNAPEWTATQNNWTASVAADFNSTVNPFEGTKHILISNTGTVGPNAELKFVNGSALNIGDYTVLKFYIKPVSNFTVIQGIALRLGNGTAFVSPLVPVRNGDFGFSRTSNTWQLINIPISAFNVTGTQFDRLYIYPISSAKNFYLDVIQLQAGITQGGTGGSQNLSWNATTHAVDITGGTSAVIPYASTTADGLINFSGSQSISGNKTFTALTTVSNVLVVNSEQILTGSAPGTPASGRGHLYALTTDDKLYWKDDNGVVYDLTAGGGGGATALNDIGDATATGAVAAANNDQTWTFDGLSGKAGFKITSATTAASSNAQILLEAQLTGANATASQFTTALAGKNYHTGTGSSNAAVLADASGGTNNYGIYATVGGAATINAAGYFDAAGGTTNYGIWVDNGTTRIDDKLEITPNFQEWYTVFDELRQNNRIAFDWSSSGASSGASAMAHGSANIIDNWMYGAVLQTGATSSGVAFIYSATAPGSSFSPIAINSSFRYNAGFKVRVEDLSTGSERYEVWSGFSDANNSVTAITDGVYFRYIDTDSSGRWIAVTESNGTKTEDETDITVAADTDYELEISVLGGNAYFYINKVLKSTITTNIPSGTARETGVACAILKTVGTTARSLYVDWGGYGVRKN